MFAPCFNNQIPLEHYLLEYHFDRFEERYPPCPDEEGNQNLTKVVLTPEGQAARER